MIKITSFSTKSISIVLVALFIGLILLLEWFFGPNYRLYLGVPLAFMVAYVVVSGLWEACTRIPSGGEDN